MGARPQNFHVLNLRSDKFKKMEGTVAFPSPNRERHRQIEFIRVCCVLPYFSIKNYFVLCLRRFMHSAESFSQHRKLHLNVHKLSLPRMSQCKQEISDRAFCQEMMFM